VPWLAGAVLDVRMLQLAGRQRSLITRRQLLGLGATVRQVETWLAAGVLFRVHHGVYALAGARQDFDFQVLAGLLAAGLHAVVSHRTAAALFGLRRVTCSSIEVTVPGRRAPKGRGLSAHRSDLLLIVRHLTSLTAVERLLERFDGERRPGARLLAELVEERRRGKRPSETGLEDELLEVFDAAYPDFLLGFEADGDKWHKGLLDRMRDEARDEQCGLIGWTVRRYGTDDIRDRPAGIADEVVRLRMTAEAA
jgi:putative AbiEi antitoxin of type IV toxin-antitoxin system